MRHLAFFLPFLAFSVHAQVVQVFGLPLGGKFSISNHCPSDRDEIRTPCWDGHSYGAIPKTTRPAWADWHSAKFSVNKAGLLDSVSFSATFDDYSLAKNNWSDAINSIQGRFGLPSTVNFFKEYSVNSWKTKNLEIEAILAKGYPSRVMVDFKHQIYIDLVKKEAAAQPKRPATP